MQNKLNSPVVTPQEFQQHIDKIWTIAFDWMNADKFWWPTHNFYVYDILSKITKQDVKKIYKELAMILGEWRVKAYVWNFRKVHRQYMKELKWQWEIKSKATREAFTYVRQLQESNYMSDQSELKKMTSQVLIENLSSAPRNNNWPTISSRLVKIWDKEENHILPQPSSWAWKQLRIDYGT